MTTSIPGGRAASRTQRALLLAAQRADHRAQDELLRRYEPLVQAMVQRMTLPACADRDDFAQEARVALLNAIGAWRPELGAFPALAERCIRNRLIMTLNYAGRHKHRVLDHALSLDVTFARGGLRPSDADEPERAAITNAQLAAIIAGLSRLTARERSALHASLNERSQKDLALEQNTTAKAVHLSERRARRKLASDPIFAAA